jgi:hypothetical protein
MINSIYRTDCIMYTPHNDLQMLITERICCQNGVNIADEVRTIRSIYIRAKVKGSLRRKARTPVQQKPECCWLFETKTEFYFSSSYAVGVRDGMAN